MNSEEASESISLVVVSVVLMVIFSTLFGLLVYKENKARENEKRRQEAEQVKKNLQDEKQERKPPDGN
jgi:heme/copper-type cytochrome/quinol oxidase subunit 2